MSVFSRVLAGPHRCKQELLGTCPAQLQKGILNSAQPKLTAISFGTSPARTMGAANADQFDLNGGIVSLHCLDLEWNYHQIQLHALMSVVDRLPPVNWAHEVIGSCMQS